ncbi:unnamed protein product [Prunus armeniaca]
MSLRNMSKIIPVFFFVLMVFLMFPATMGGVAQGLSIKMFTILSPNSSIFPQNLTLFEKHQKLTEISKARALDLIMTTSSSETLVPNAISSPVKHAYSDFYYIEMYVGTPPQKTNLALDTGSTLTWVQCEGCKSCFELSMPNFSIRRSTTSRPMPDDHPLCVPPNLGPGTKGQNCVYGLFYYDRSSTYGPFGFDAFTFLSDQGQLAIPNVAFGWGLFNKVNFNDYFHGHDNPIGGILGLGRGHPIGILQQLNQITLRRFSYCLPPQFEAQSLLHFGEDAQIGGPSLGSTPILGGPDDYYFTKLDAISFNGQRLQIDPSLFMAGGKGMAVDSGSPYSHIVAEAFKVLKQAVVDYFHNMYGWQPMTQKSKTDFDLCYQNIPTVFTSPSVTLHFEGADFVLHKPTLFQAFEHHNEFCMTILSMDQSDGLNILGAAQQVNYRFLFDIAALRLSFSPENC